jgi:hypothetical protein
MTTRRIGPAQVEWVAERLSGRDWQIIEAVNVVRLLSGSQIERLLFADLAPGRSRIASRSRTLHRLVAWRVLVALPRRIGGAGRGSTTLAFALDSTGQRLMRERLLAGGQLPRVRRPGAPTERTVRHTLAVAEAFVSLTELSREHGFTLATFQAEPASWWPNGLGSGYIKPDAHTTLVRDKIRDHWWCELDLATESLPAVKRQLASYLDFWERGQLGPGKIMPRVVIATITPERQAAIARLVKQLPSAPADLFLVVQIHELASVLHRVLLE